ncbi:DUF805 domain-containing protein [Vibrio pelagius]|uniref:DUF805 domain-containing protein n=1 Tax=Vibrio pelagius TaxID=28169 RepID=UPI0021C46700|nr:DUF805 domain-containing protein [Vibrio pelagius]
MSLKALLFSFKGRISRRPYWLVSIALLLWGSVLNQVYFSQFNEQNLMQISDVILTLTNMVIVIWINFAVQVKRWHDRDKVGWWALLWLIPIIGQIWVIIECGFFKGTPGQNRFGSSPTGEL